MFWHKKKHSCQKDGGGQGNHCRMELHHHHQRRHQRCRNGKNLMEFEEGKKTQIVFNPDTQTMEMGLYPGAVVTVVRNNPDDANIIVASGNSRLIVPKEVAEEVMVRCKIKDFGAAKSGS